MQILPHRGMSSAKVSKSGGSVKYGDADFSVFVCFFPFFIIPSDEPLVFRDEIRIHAKTGGSLFCILRHGMQTDSNRFDLSGHILLFYPDVSYTSSGSYGGIIHSNRIIVTFETKFCVDFKTIHSIPSKTPSGSCH